MKYKNNMLDVITVKRQSVILHPNSVLRCHHFILSKKRSFDNQVVCVREESLHSQRVDVPGQAVLPTHLHRLVPVSGCHLAFGADHDLPVLRLDRQLFRFELVYGHGQLELPVLGGDHRRAELSCAGDGGREG